MRVVFVFVSMFIFILPPFCAAALTLLPHRLLHMQCVPGCGATVQRHHQLPGRNRCGAVWRTSILLLPPPAIHLQTCLLKENTK